LAERYCVVYQTLIAATPVIILNSWPAQIGSHFATMKDIGVDHKGTKKRNLSHRKVPAARCNVKNHISKRRLL